VGLNVRSRLNLTSIGTMGTERSPELKSAYLIPFRMMLLQYKAFKQLPHAPFFEIELSRVYQQYGETVSSGGEVSASVAMSFFRVLSRCFSMYLSRCFSRRSNGRLCYLVLARRPK
jgi:hypothetical protein